MAHTIEDSIIELADKYTVNHSSESYNNNKLMLKEFKTVLVKKTCDWLKENVKYYSHPKYQGEELTDETYIAEQLYYDFCKVMEE